MTLRKLSSPVSVPRPAKTIRVGMLSLGCPKNLVDSETVLGFLKAEGLELAESAADCDVAIVNTCGFILDAQRESVDRILELAELKKEGAVRGIVVMGCLSQRFPEQLRKDLSEVDAFLGAGDYEKIPGIVRRVFAGEKIFRIGEPGYLPDASVPRIALTPKFYRYIKISEGCDHRCSFCSIPSFRGPHRSRTIADVAAEARRLVREGARELILTGQDTTAFGRDRGRKDELAELLRELDGVPGGGWIRVLYSYPSSVTDDLIRVMATGRHICRYLDIPLQHASDRILRSMRRGVTKKTTFGLIRRLRQEVPGIALRTSFIVGFPGETERDFRELLETMRAVRFERLGIFLYSAEEGTPAAGYPGQIQTRVQRERFEAAMRVQQEISLENNRAWIGKSLRVLIESKDENNPSLWTGRSYMDAPEVDGTVFVRSEKPLRPGRFYDVRIRSTKEYDLEGEI